MIYSTGGTFVVKIRMWSATAVTFPWLAGKDQWKCLLNNLYGNSTGFYLLDPEAPDFARYLLIPFEDIEYYHEDTPGAQYYATPVVATSNKPDWQIQAEAHGWTPPAADISSFSGSRGAIISMFEKAKLEDDALAMSEVKSWDKTNGTKVKVTSYVQPYLG